MNRQVWVSYAKKLKAASDKLKVESDDLLKNSSEEDADKALMALILMTQSELLIVIAACALRVAKEIDLS